MQLLKRRRFAAKLILTTSSLLLASLFSAQYTLADTKYTNLNGYTLNQKGELISFSQFVVDNDLIVAVGDAADAITPDTVIDLKGKTVLPGLIDAHGHILGLGAN